MKRREKKMATTKKKLEETSDEILREELEKQIRQEERLKKKALTDQVLRFLGLILASIIFLISFSMLAWGTIFAGLFDLNATEVWTQRLPFVFESGSIYYSFIGPDPTVAIILMSVIQIALAFILAFLISYYIRDLIGIIKEIFNLGKNITNELGTNLKEGVEEMVGVTINKDGKKSLFGDSNIFNKSKESRKNKVEKELEKIKREAAKSNIEITVPSDSDSETDDLDKALTDPNYKPAEKKPDPKKSLFDSK
jgi:hypothetical protein